MFSATIGGLLEGSPQCGRHACHPPLLHRLHVGGASGIQFTELHPSILTKCRYMYNIVVGRPTQLIYISDISDDQHRNTNMNDKDHLVGQLTNNNPQLADLVQTLQDTVTSQANELATLKSEVAALSR